MKISQTFDLLPRHLSAEKQAVRMRALVLSALLVFLVWSGVGSQTIVDSPLPDETQGNLFGDVCARLSCLSVNPNDGRCTLREYVPRCYPTGYVPTALQLEQAGLAVQETALVTAQPTDYAFKPQGTPAPEFLTLACANNQLLVNGGCATVTQTQLDEAVVDYNRNAQLAALGAFVVLAFGLYFFFQFKKK